MRHSSYRSAIESAQANANAQRKPWGVFSDTSGAWNSEPLTSCEHVADTLSLVRVQPVIFNTYRRHGKTYLFVHHRDGKVQVIAETGEHFGTYFSVESFKRSLRDASQLAQPIGTAELSIRALAD